MQKDSIGNRMKNNYENPSRFYLNKRIPVIMRLDGKAFHSFRHILERPFDSNFRTVMKIVGSILLNSIQGAKCAYLQSDEISILITDFDRFNTSAWFDYNIQKMTSVSAACATAAFATAIRDLHPKSNLMGMALFDSRVFNIPKEEVYNYFIWRQQDWIRNSVQMYCQYHFSHSQLLNKNQQDMHEMLHGIGKNWATDLNDEQKNGRFLYLVEGEYGKELKDKSDIIFTQERINNPNIIDPYLYNVES